MGTRLMRLITLVFDIGVLLSLLYTLSHLIEVWAKKIVEDYQLPFSAWKFCQRAIILIACLGLTFLVAIWVVISVIKVLQGI